jgi:putative endonuclease
MNHHAAIFIVFLQTWGGMVLKMQNIKKVRGDFGEDTVCNYLKKNLYEIVARNFRKKSGEIDIIAIKNQIISFIEVKTRKFGSLTDGVSAVTKEKQRRIVKTAGIFLTENPCYYNKTMRFDVADVIITNDVHPVLLELKYYEEAFDPMLLN